METETEVVDGKKNVRVSFLGLVGVVFFGKMTVPYGISGVVFVST